jgi:hypothetical protein
LRKLGAQRVLHARAQVCALLRVQRKALCKLGCPRCRCHRFRVRASDIKPQPRKASLHPFAADIDDKSGM